MDGCCRVLWSMDLKQDSEDSISHRIKELVDVDSIAGWFDLICFALATYCVYIYILYYNICIYILNMNNIFSCFLLTTLNHILYIFIIHLQKICKNLSLVAFEFHMFAAWKSRHEMSVFHRGCFTGLPQSFDAEIFIQPALNETYRNVVFVFAAHLRDCPWVDGWNPVV